METISGVLAALLKGKMAALVASVAGAAIHIAFSWKGPLYAVRQFIVCVVFGVAFGPQAYHELVYFIPHANSESTESAVHVATAFLAFYALEMAIAIMKARGKRLGG